MHLSTVLATLLVSSGAIASAVPRRAIPIELLGRDVEPNAYRVCGTRLCVDLTSQTCSDSSECTGDPYRVCCVMTNYFPPKEIWRRDGMSKKGDAPKGIEA
ncbi:hypothetical protein B0T16DRAFT_410721 [Cercophora newfieldiana]|uniref:Uncharacterized protein n=1 Tax=Cercophora newfieldiana TaxID=92897 RepID=A0AA39YE20_9PEZI|nr:hypothetical protein B0T16DRAFT_410721 [Cercophora newfieldiana]